MSTYSKQRADLTFKHNTNHGRHGWLRLTPAYSVKVVEEILQGFNDGQTVIDPFSGTGTTALCAAEKGHNGIAVEINPFLVWLGQVKVQRYSDRDIKQAYDIGLQVENVVRNDLLDPSLPPPISNINRWWNGSNLLYLRMVRSAVEHLSSPSTSTRDLLDIAFCRCLISLSNASFNHQSLSFKNSESTCQLSLWDETSPAPDYTVFCNELEGVLQGANVNPLGTGRVILGDSRNINEIMDKRVDAVITSPPYPNRMSYIRELRPYMYWLGFLKHARTAGDLDWQAIGGTWGIATSRLNDWKPQEANFLPGYMEKAIKQVAASDTKSSHLLANYIRKYFEDIKAHFLSLKHILKTGTVAHYIVGNSTFYGVLIPVEQVYADLMQAAGFDSINVKPIRKRNSKKELFEFDVNAKYCDKS